VPKLYWPEAQALGAAYHTVITKLAAPENEEFSALHSSLQLLEEATQSLEPFQRDDNLKSFYSACGLTAHLAQIIHSEYDWLVEITALFVITTYSATNDMDFRAQASHWQRQMKHTEAVNSVDVSQAVSKAIDLVQPQTPLSNGWMREAVEQRCHTHRWLRPLVRASVRSILQASQHRTRYLNWAIGGVLVLAQDGAQPNDDVHTASTNLLKQMRLQS
jgi:hypothetical protein